GLSRRAQNWVNWSANVATKDNLTLSTRVYRLQVQESSAEYMTGIPVLAPNARRRLKMRPVREGLQHGQDGLSILTLKQRQGRAVLTIPPLVCPPGFFFLQMRRIQQQDASQIGGCIGAIDWPLEAHSHQARQVTDVVH